MRYFTRQFMVFVLAAVYSCETKQVNLNSTIGWKESIEVPIFLLKWQNAELNEDSFHIELKKDIENKVLAALIENHIGEQAERDSADVANMLFVIIGKREKAEKVILETIKASGQQGKIDVLERKHITYNKWIDSLIIR